MWQPHTQDFGALVIWAQQRNMPGTARDSMSCARDINLLCLGAKRSSIGNCLVCCSSHSHELQRSGCLDDNYEQFCETGGVNSSAAGSPIAFLVSNVTISDSTFSGVQIRGPDMLSNTSLDGLLIDSSETWGVEIYEGAQGSAILRNSRITTSGEGSTRNGAGDAFKLLQ